jgi:hypothetical protein
MISMYENIWIDAAILVGALHLVVPAIVKRGFWFAARCKPLAVPVDELPKEVASYIFPRIPQMENLGFELLGCHDLGMLTSNTQRYVAYFVKRSTNDFANVTVTTSPPRIAAYFEFSARFANGLTLETNTNSILPFTPDNPETQVFRFPKIKEPQALYRLHLRLIQKHAGGQWAQGEPKGQELERLIDVVENYAPRHAKTGYMVLAKNGRTYRLTWKGALLMTWCGLWPTSLVRNALQRKTMQSELQALPLTAAAELQKA